MAQRSSVVESHSVCKLMYSISKMCTPPRAGLLFGVMLDTRAPQLLSVGRDMTLVSAPNMGSGRES